MSTRLNYAIQCTDTLSGVTGSFGFDAKEYLNADGPLGFKARTPVFSNLMLLFGWARENNVELVFEPIDWEANRGETH